MKVEKFIRLIDPLTRIIMWDAEAIEIEGENEAKPAYDGYLMDMPWYLLDYKIGRPAGDDDEPIYVSQVKHKVNENIIEPVIIINILPPDWKD